MKSLLVAGVVLLTQFGVVPALAGCSEPMAFTEIPNGAKATREEMLSAQRAMKAYDNAVKAFTDCLNQEGDTSNRANLAVDKLQKLAEKFNVELHSFKERNGAS
jgi:hypothetical protein